MSEVDEIRVRIKYTREMMETMGWEFLLRDWKEDVAAAERQIILNSKSYEEIQFLRGALSVLHRLVNLEKVIDAAEQFGVAVEAQNEAG
jgi:hypothetical protein